MITMLSAEELVEPVAAKIRSTSAQAEAERRMPNDLMNDLLEAGIFSIYTPREFGGLDLPLPEALRVVEEVSRHDGSAGWTVALGLANSIFTSVLSDKAATKVLGNGPVLIAGAPAFGVRAQPVDGGFQMTGRWAYNSGAPNANWIAAAFPIFDGDAPRVGSGGPEMVFAFLPPSDVQVIDTWHVTGLRASGTQDLYVEDVFVPQEMTGDFSLPAGPRPVRNCILAKLPFFTLLGVAQSPPVCLGIAQRAIEEFRQIAQNKQSAFGPRLGEQVQAHEGLARAQALVRSARCYFFENAGMIWDAATEDRELSAEERASARIASLTAAENCRVAVDLLYRLAGTTAIFQSSPLERCWRDVNTAAQHMQVQNGRWETAGRVLLGLDPGSPIL